ncbi:unnamed protein product [Closterium sp. NIES-53]
MANVFLTGATVASPSFTTDFGKIPTRRAPSTVVTTGVHLAPVRAEAPHYVVANVTASPIPAKVSDATTSVKASPSLATPTTTPANDDAPRCRRCNNPCTKDNVASEAPDFYPFTSLPSTPVFPSHTAMALFLQAYARMLQHVQTATSGVARVDPVDRVDHSQDALVSGESLARKERAEQCLAELECDIETLRSAHERPPRATTLALVTIHCIDAARIIIRLLNDHYHS